MKVIMRTKLAIVAVILGLVALAGGPAFGGTNGDPFVLNVTKAVEGESPAGPYGVNVTCGLIVFDFEISDGETVSSGAPLDFGDECIVTETDDLDADAVTYACEATLDSTCVNDQTVRFDLSDAGGVGSITITNTFEPEPEAAPDTVARQPGVVAAQPAFTG
jgi:hypothetical protein